MGQPPDSGSATRAGAHRPPVEIRDPYPQEWTWKYSKTRGLLQHLMLAITRRMRWRGKRGYVTGELPASDLARDTGYHEDTVRHRLSLLEREYGDELLVVKPRRRGDPYQYGLRLQAHLPLDDESAGAAPSDTGSRVGSHRIDDPVTSDRESGGSLDQDQPSTKDQAAPLVLAENVAQWIGEHYRTYHPGKHLYVVSANRLRKVVFLVQQYGEEFLKEMADTMWTMRPEENRWIALETDDRGIDLLYARHKEIAAVARARKASRTDDESPPGGDLRRRNAAAIAEALEQCFDDLDDEESHGT